MPQEDSIAVRLARVRARVADANARYGGRASLLAVSKTFPEESVLAAWRAGQTAFGENYCQEGERKVRWFRDNHPDSGLEWRFIGPLQGNKTRPVAECFDWVESVDRERVARRLSAQRPDGLPPLNVLIEVNIDAQASKSGVLPADLPPLLELVASLPRLRLRGLMVIPAPVPDREGRLRPLRAARRLFDEYREAWSLDTLSMGMSADLEEAIAAGSTEVRVGTAIFGPRSYPSPGQP